MTEVVGESNNEVDPSQANEQGPTCSRETSGACDGAQNPVVPGRGAWGRHALSMLAARPRNTIDGAIAGMMGGTSTPRSR